MLVAKFLKQGTPFATLDPMAAASLARRVRRQTAAAGDLVLRQGEPGDAAYLLRRGRVEIVLERDGGERVLGTLGAGAPFGEAVLLVEAPRNASVRAIEAAELLVLGRDDLLGAIAASNDVQAEIGRLLNSRDRPRRLRGTRRETRVAATQKKFSARPEIVTEGPSCRRNDNSIASSDKVESPLSPRGRA
jgi:CRP-like cAMP-binding protein